MSVARSRPGTYGFTYIGVLILVAVLGVGLAATATLWETAQRRENERELLFIGRQFAAALRSYDEATPAGKPRFPSKLEDLLEDPRQFGVRRHLRKVYVDPMTRKAQWGLVLSPGGGILAVHSLSQQQPLKVAEFEAQFAAFTRAGKYSDWKFGMISAAPAVRGAKPSASSGPAL